MRDRLLVIKMLEHNSLFEANWRDRRHIPELRGPREAGAKRDGEKILPLFNQGLVKHVG